MDAHRRHIRPNPFLFFSPVLTIAGRLRSRSGEERLQVILDLEDCRAMPNSFYFRTPFSFSTVIRFKRVRIKLIVIVAHEIQRSSICRS